MNAVEIEEALSALLLEPFDEAAFPFQFLAAFGFSDTTLKKLQSSAASSSDVAGAVLQRNQIHILVTPLDEAEAGLAALRASPRTLKSKTKFILATDGEQVLAEATDGGPDDCIACSYTELANHFAFFLPLAGISTVVEIRDNPVDIKATGRLNKIYVELLKDNPDWATAAKRPALNQLMARLIFCFFAEDTGVFSTAGIFTQKLREMTDAQSINTHEVICELFRAMNTKDEEREQAGVKRWAYGFRYVNGGLFSGDIDCPRFSKMARSYLLRAGELDWQKINPDIFGSMIQAVADDDERGSLGMHYTSVPNILKVLDPLFLEDLREQLAAAGDNPRKLLNLRKRIAAIRVFDPACGSGNFLVIAYIKLREIEAEICRLRADEPGDRKTLLQLTNFFGIEIKSFPAEIARLALLIAEFQCNVRFLGQHAACLDMLPLHDTGRIHCGNALQLDWVEICPPEANGSLDYPIETFVCGNPPYRGGTEQSAAQKEDMVNVFTAKSTTFRSLDYVACWFAKWCDYAQKVKSAAAFVATNSICQGEQVARLWPLVFDRGFSIAFAHTSFRWSNLAKKKAGVTVVVIGLKHGPVNQALLFNISDQGSIARRVVAEINAYLIAFKNVIVKPASEGTSDLAAMVNGNKPADGGHLLISRVEMEAVRQTAPVALQFARRFIGSHDSIQGNARFCLWIKNEERAQAESVPFIAERLNRVRAMREDSTKALTLAGANSPHLFQQIRQRGDETIIVVPRHSSESRNFLPISLHGSGTILSDAAFGLLNAKLWNFSILSSRIHTIWIAAVCGKIKEDYRYASTLGWNTFPIPTLTETDKAELTRCAEEILLAREAHFPATLADLYDPETMPANLRAAHDRNDETLERIYIGRRFRNDTERLEKLFEMYSAMAAKDPDKAAKPAKRATKRPKGVATTNKEVNS